MSANKILPFVKDPYSIMYHYTAFPLSIVQAKMEKEIFEQWFVSKYINTSFDYNSKGNKFNIGEDLWFTNEEILYRHHFSVSKSVYSNNDIDLIEIIKNMINKGYYPQGNYNEQFVPGKSAYLDDVYYHHDYLLVGYDDNDNCFTSVGYIDNKYQEFKIPYFNMQKAIETLEGTFIRVDFLEYNESKEIVFDLKKITDELEKYINSMGLLDSSTNKHYGISSIKDLIEFFESNASTNKKIDMRYVRGLMEHKFFMNNRINYLYNSGYLINPEYIISSKKVYELATMIFMLSLKYSSLKNESLINKITTLLGEMIDKESYLVNVVKELKVH